MSSVKVLSDKLFAENTVTKLKKDFEDAKPFPWIRVDDFLTDSFLSSLQSCLEQDVSFYEKNNDLYQFHQSYALQTIKAPAIEQLKQALYSDKMRSLLHNITGIQVSDTADLFASVYRDTDYLLCHDDQIEDRKIAFILYLVPSDWTESDGGTLDIYSSSDPSNVSSDPNQNQHSANCNNSSSSSSSSTSGTDGDDSFAMFPSDTPAQKLVPVRNSVVLFEVSNKSYHSVAQVLSSEKSRIAIGGWFHDFQATPNKVLTPQPEPPLQWHSVQQQENKSDDSKNGLEAIIENDAARLEFVQKSKLLAKWVNETYLTATNMEAIQNKFLEESSINLYDFLKPSLYYKLVEAVGKVKNTQNVANESDQNKDTLRWQLKGPCHRRLYYQLQGKYCDKNLNKNEKKSGSKQDVEDTKDSSGDLNDLEVIGEFEEFMRSQEWRAYLEQITNVGVENEYCVEARKFEIGNYTIAHDLDALKKMPEALDVQFVVLSSEEFGWNEKYGGTTYYMMAQDVKNNDNNYNIAGATEKVVTDEIEDIDVSDLNAGNGENGENGESGETEVSDDEGVDGEQTFENDVLLKIECIPNTLALVYRSEPGVVSFVKHLNHYAPCDRVDWTQTWKVKPSSDDEDETENQDETEDTGVPPPAKKQRLMSETEE